MVFLIIYLMVNLRGSIDVYKLLDEKKNKKSKTGIEPSTSAYMATALTDSIEVEYKEF